MKTILFDATHVSTNNSIQYRPAVMQKVLREFIADLKQSNTINTSAYPDESGKVSITNIEVVEDSEGNVIQISADIPHARGIVAMTFSIDAVIDQNDCKGT